MPISIGDLNVYTVEEVSELLGYRDLTIRRLIREGQIKGRKLGNRWYVTEEALQDYFRGGADTEREGEDHG